MRSSAGWWYFTQSTAVHTRACFFACTPSQLWGERQGGWSAACLPACLLCRYIPKWSALPFLPDDESLHKKQPTVPGFIFW